MSKSLKMIIEALLFSSDKPLTVKDIHDVLPDVEKTEIKNSIKILTHDYDALERSFVLKEVAGGYQFRSRPEYGAYILRMFQKTPNRLSKATVETLAIIAYKQPILRSEIERLRGVDVGGIIKTLMEKGLVKIMGRKELPGRPLVYGTTKKFLEVFDLKDIKSLPKLKEIKDFAADQYEPTLINNDESTEEGSAEENIFPTDDHSEEVYETETGTDDVQAEAIESDMEEIPEDIQTDADTGYEESDNSEPESYIDAEENYVSEHDEDTYEDVYEEDAYDEDVPSEPDDLTDPDDDIDPEENGTET